MSKFKLGDVVVRTEDVAKDLPVGIKVTVIAVDEQRKTITVSDYPGLYDPDNFELYNPNNIPGKEREILQAYLDGKVIQVRESTHCLWGAAPCGVINLNLVRIKPVNPNQEIIDEANEQIKELQATIAKLT